jgi:hypothetical protein
VFESHRIHVLASLRMLREFSAGYQGKAAAHDTSRSVRIATVAKFIIECLVPDISLTIIEALRSRWFARLKRCLTSCTDRPSLACQANASESASWS